MSFLNKDLPSSDSESDDDYVPDASNVLTSDDEEPHQLCKAKLRAIEEEKEKAREELKKSMAEKQKANDLYKAFLSEVEEDERRAKSCYEGASSSTSYESAPSSITVSSQVDVVKSSLFSSDVSPKPSVETPENKSCKLFDFAGETVAVSSDGTILPGKETPVCRENVPVKPEVKKRGLDAVLSKIQDKKPKLSVLDKTNMDWKSFKKSEAIEDELTSFRKSKQGFIERQRFLERSDFRAYEIERDVRLSKSKKKK